jgi:hypothetical protein
MFSSKKLKVCVPKRESNKNSIVLRKDLAEPIEITVDLDGIFGLFTAAEFAERFKTSFFINFQRDEAVTGFKTIKSGLDIGSGKFKKNINTHPHFKIGYANTSIGCIDFYIVSLNREIIESADLKALFYDSLITLLQDNDKKIHSKNFLTIGKMEKDVEVKIISGFLLTTDYLNVFGYLFELLKTLKLSIYIESFGNKNTTTTRLNEIETIYEKINGIFETKKAKMLYADICLSVSKGKNNVTFAGDEIFELFKIKPNYRPLFCDAVMNLNVKKTQKCFDNLKIYKFNLYSTFKTTLCCTRKDIYYPNVTASLFLNRTFGCCVYGSKEKVSTLLDTKFNVMKFFDGKSSKEYLYRMELRIKLSKLTQLVNDLVPDLVSENFYSCNSLEFFKIIKITLDNACEFLLDKKKDLTQSYFTPEILVRSMIMESILNSLYLNGSNICRWLNKEMNFEINRLVVKTEHIIKVQSFEKLTNSVIKALRIEDKIKMFEKLIKYIPRVSQTSKYLLQRISEIYFNFKNYDWKMELLKIYLMENNNGTSEDIKALLIPANNLAPIISYDKWAESAFKITTKSGKSKISRMLFIMFRDLLEKDDVEMIYLFKIFLTEQNVISIPISSKRGKVFNYYKLMIDCESERRNELINFFNNLNINPAINVPRDANETIRYCSSLLKHSNSYKRYINISNDLSYGFYFTRNLDWLKNKFHYLNDLVRSKSEFIQTMKMIIEWEPSKFSFEDHLNYLSEFDIIFDDQEKNNFRELIELANTEWLSNDFRDEITNEDFEVLFKTLIKSSKRYSRVILNKVETWSREEKEERFINAVENNENLNDADNNSNFNNFESNFKLESIGSDVSFDLNDFNEYSYEDRGQEDFNANDTNYNDDDLNSNYESNNLNNDFDGNQINHQFDVDHQNFEKEESVFLKECKNEFSDNQEVFKAKDLELENVIVASDVLHTSLSNFLGSQSLKPVPEITELKEGINVLAQDIKDILENDEASYFFQKIFKCFKYRKFNPFLIRKERFNNNLRLDFNILSESISKLLKFKIISDLNTKTFRFNLKIEGDKKYLAYEEIIELVKKKFLGRDFSFNQLRHSLKSNKRPAINDWKLYMSDLVDEKELICNFLGPYCFSFNHN